MVVRLISVWVIATLAVSAVGREASWDERQLVVEHLTSQSAGVREFRVVAAWVNDDPDIVHSEVWSEAVHAFGELCVVQTYHVSVSRLTGKSESESVRGALAWLAQHARECRVRNRQDLPDLAIGTNAIASAQVIDVLSNAKDLVRQAVEVEYLSIDALPPGRDRELRMKMFRELVDDPGLRIESLEAAHPGELLDLSYGFGFVASLGVRGRSSGIRAAFSVRPSGVIVHSTVSTVR